MNELSEEEKKSVFAAAGVMILTILAILSYVYTGASWSFYIIVILAVLLGFYVTHRISDEARRANTRAGSAPRKRERSK